MAEGIYTVREAVAWLRERADRVTFRNKAKQATALDRIADLMVEMQQEIGDLEDLAEELMEEPSQSSERIAALLDVRQRLEAELGPEDRINLAQTAYDAIDMMIEEELFGEPEECDCPSCRRVPASAPQGRATGPSLGARLPTQPESETGAVRADAEGVTDLRREVQAILKKHADRVAAVEVHWYAGSAQGGAGPHQF